MRILIYGAGVIGSVFAARLHLAGYDVTVLARGQRLEALRQNGIVLHPYGSRKAEIAHVKVIDCLTPNDRYDYILVAMQRTQVDSVLEPLAANASANIVLIVNTAAGYADWLRAVGKDRLMIGFPSAGGERRGGEVHYFVGHGLMRMLQTTTFGELDGQKTKRLQTLIGMFRHAHIPCVSCPDMDAWQKTHVAMVTSIANALYGYDCDAQRLAASRKDIRAMVLGIKEGFDVLKALGIRITPRKTAVWRLPAGMLASGVKAFMGTRLAELLLVRHCVSAKAEMIALQCEFDRLVQKSGCRTPNINRLRENLTACATHSAKEQVQ